MHHLLIGASFADPIWSPDQTWASLYAKNIPSYIIAKAGIGIKGICTEAYYYLQEINDVSKVIIMLPDLWKIDIEMDPETYLCNCIVDLVEANETGYTIVQKNSRKWIISGTLTWDKKTEESKIFDFILKHQGFLVIAKEHFRALKHLINLCKERNIEYYITSSSDPLDEFVGLEYIVPEIKKILEEVEYSKWLRFDNNFVNKFLGHTDHPNAEEHKILCKHILENTNKGNK